MQKLVEQDEIASIELVGEEMTYDIAMASPANNYIANHFVVHNSVGLQKYSRDLGIDTFENLVAASALYRPGTLHSGEAQEYVLRKNGKHEVSYPHPAMEAITKDTLGIMVYQEQIMKIAHDIGGQSWSTSEMIRKVISKSGGKKMFDEIRESFIQHAWKKLGMSEAEATTIYNNVSTFGSYGFNKSHSTSYSVLSYMCAYLKTYYPAAFFSALLDREDDPEMSKRYIQNAKKMGVVVVAPDASRSKAGWAQVSDNEISCGLLAIKTIGPAASTKIVKAQPFKTLHELRKAANKGAFKALIASGSCDNMGLPSRKWVLENVDSIYAKDGKDLKIPKEADEYPDKERALLQNEYLDSFSATHIITYFADPLKKYKIKYEPIADLQFEGFINERWIKGMVTFINFKQEGLEGSWQMFNDGLLERKYAHLNVNDESDGNVLVHLSPEQYTFYKRHLERRKFPVAIKAHSIPEYQKLYCDAMIVLDDVDQSNPIFNYVSGKSHKVAGALRKEFPKYENFYTHIGVVVSATYKVKDKKSFVRLVFADKTRFVTYEMVPGNIYVAGQVLRAKIAGKDSLLKGTLLTDIEIIPVK